MRRVRWSRPIEEHSRGRWREREESRSLAREEPSELFGIPIQYVGRTYTREFLCIFRAPARARSTSHRWEACPVRARSIDT